MQNWLNDKYIICNGNNIPIKIPSLPYALVNRSVLCNCGIEAENHFLLESLAACQGINSKLIMYFTVNTAFINYLDQFPNLTESLKLLIIKNKTTFEQTIPISLNVSKFDSTLLTASSNLKDFMIAWKLLTKISFLNIIYIIEIFVFITAIISFLATTLTVYLLCKHKKLRMLMVSIVLHQVKEVGSVTQKEINTECKTLTYISLALTILGLVVVAILHYRKLKLCRGSCSPTQ